VIPLRDDIRADRRPLVTYILVASCTLVFFYQLMAQFSNVEAGNAIVLNLGMIPHQIVRGQRLWTLVTSMFLHGGFFHIIGNMLYLWIFGNNVEDSMGHVRFLVFYLLCGLAAAALQIAFQPDSPVPMVGASGAIGGVMGAYIVLYPRVRVHMLVVLGFYVTTIAVPAAFMLGYWFLLQLLGGAMDIGARPGGGTAFWAHIGGFAAGMLLIFAFRDLELLARHPHHGWRGSGGRRR